jgi:tetratricopeptide (TPR) repeat protein
MGHGPGPQVNVNLSRTIRDYAKMGQDAVMRIIALSFFAMIAGVASAAAQPAIAPACREAPAEEAIKACTDFLKGKGLAPDQRSFALVKRGDAHFKLRDEELALKDYGDAIAINPKAGVAYNQRGNVFVKRGDYDLAIESYSTSIALQSQFPVRFTNRGFVYRLKGDLDRALADFDAAIKLGAKESRPFIERAVVYRLKLDYPRALADNNVAVRIDPENPVTFRERARTQEARGDLKAALADFRQALTLAPRDERLQRAVARVEGRIANPDQAPQPPAAADTKKPGDVKVAAPNLRLPGQRVALVIGNSRYGNVTQLSNPKNDAEALSKALRAVGFTSVNLKLDLTREQLAAALKEFAAQADKAEWAVIYYAGHGIEVGGNNYLVPIDAKFSSDRDVSFEAVTLDQVLQSVEGASKLRLVILDACRDNPFVAKMKKGTGTRSVGKGLGNIEPEGATLVAYAAKHGQTAEDGQSGNSPFAMALVKQIQTPGLEINLVFRKVRDDVLAATGKRQEPFTYGSLPSEAFYFKAN